MGARSTYVALSPEQVYQLSPLFVTQLEWVQVYQSILRVYGNNIARIVIETDNCGYYDDENCHPAITELKVYDRDGEKLDPKPELPCSQQMLEKYGAEYKDRADEQRTLVRLLTHHSARYLPIKRATYLVDSPPMPTGIYVKRRDLKHLEQQAEALRGYRDSEDDEDEE